MKTVSGKVLSSKPISLSKAASTLSSFVSTDTGASQAICAYLRRSLASFKELKQLHKELKAPRSERKRVRHRSGSENDDAETVGDNRAQSVVVSQEVSHGHEPELETESTRHQQEGNNNEKFEGQDGERERKEQKKKKKKKKKKEKTGELNNFGEDGGEIAGRAGEGVEKESNNNEKFEDQEGERERKKKKNRKKEKKDELRNFGEDGGEIAGRAGEGVEKGEEAPDSAEIHSKKKKKQKKKDNNGNFVENGVQIEEGDAGVKLGNEEVKREEKRKRKSGVLEDGGIDALEDQLDKKKKRRKS